MSEPVTPTGKRLIAEARTRHRRLLGRALEAEKALPESVVDWADIIGDDAVGHIEDLLPTIEAEAAAAERDLADQLAEALRNLGPLDKYGSGWEEARSVLVVYEEARR